MEDQEIIALYIERNTDAIRNTNEKYGNKLGYLAERILSSKEDAAECVNDTLFHAWNSIPSDKPEYLYAYLAKICRNLSLNRLDWRKAQKRDAVVVELTKELENCIYDERSVHSETPDEITESINTFLRGLTPEKRNMFLRRYWYADSCREIAERFHCSEGKVKVTLHRIRKELKKFLLKGGIKI